MIVKMTILRLLGSSDDKEKIDVLRFHIYSILHAFTFLVSLIRIGYRLQVF